MTFDELRTATIAVATWQGAREALSRFCHGKGRMSIPVQPDDDDLVISAMLDMGERLVPVARAAILETDNRLIRGCQCPVCEAIRKLPAELRERLMKEAGE